MLIISLLHASILYSCGLNANYLNPEPIKRSIKHWASPRQMCMVCTLVLWKFWHANCWQAHIWLSPDCLFFDLNFMNCHFARGRPCNPSTEGWRSRGPPLILEVDLMSLSWRDLHFTASRFGNIYMTRFVLGVDPETFKCKCRLPDWPLETHRAAIKARCWFHGKKLHGTNSVWCCVDGFHWDVDWR